MANEILKDEILSEEELDNVAGGTLKEVSLDLEFLRDIGFDVQQRNKNYIYNYFSEVANQLRSTWLQAGVRCQTISNSDYTKNVYTDQSGNPITRKAAMEMAMNFKGVTVDPAKYGAH